MLRALHEFGHENKAWLAPAILIGLVVFILLISLGLRGIITEDYFRVLMVLLIVDYACFFV